MPTYNLTITAIVLATCVCVSFGGCVVEDIAVMENFTKSRMMGLWYETYWVPSYFEKPEKAWNDFVEVWSPADDANKIASKEYGRPKNATTCMSGLKSYEKSEGEEAAKWWTYKYETFPSIKHAVDVWFIDVKYDAYALAYGCNIIDEETGECTSAHAWLWSRTQVLSSDDMAAVINILPSVCLGIDDFRKMKYIKECARDP